MIILANTVSTVTGIIIAAITFVAGTILSYFLWNLFLKRKKDILLKEAESDGEAQKRDKILHH